MSSQMSARRRSLFNTLGDVLFFLVAAALIFPGLGLAEPTQKLVTDPLFLYTVKGSAVVAQSGPYRSLAEAYAVIEQRAAELEPCPPDPDLFMSRLTIQGNLRPMPGTKMVNGMPLDWIYDYSSKQCYFGTVTNYTGGITMNPTVCSDNGGGLVWRRKSRTIDSSAIEYWCEAEFTLPDDVSDPCGKQQPPPIGNPVSAATGRKTQTEFDYRSADGALEFVRHYDNFQGGFFSLLSSRVHDFSGTGASMGCFDSRFSVTPSGGVTIDPTYCFPYLALSDSSYQVITSTGRQLPYSGTPDTLVSRININDRLEWLPADQGGPGWRLIFEDNTVESYDSEGYLTARQWPDGRRMSVEYPAAGERLPARYVDQAGRTLSFSYDASGNVIEMLDPASAPYRFTHEAIPGGCFRGRCFRLTSVQYPDGSSRGYRYNEAQQTGGLDLPVSLTGRTDERGIRVGTYSYDSQGRVTSTEAADGLNRYAVAYNTYGWLTTVTDPLGSIRNYTVTTLSGTKLVTNQSQPAGSGCAAAAQAMTYDTYNNLTTRTDFNGARSCYKYDARNLETVRVEGLSGTSCSYTAPGATLPSGARKISTEWAPFWRMKSRVAEPSRLTTYVYNGELDPTTGAVAACAPGSATVIGRPIAVLCKKIEQPTLDANGAQGFAAATTGSQRILAFTYNEFGKVLTADGPRIDVADVTSYEYYGASDGCLGCRGNVSQITEPTGLVTRFTHYNPHGRVEEMIKPDGVTVGFAYNLRQRLTASTVGNETTQYDYDPSGRLIQITAPDASWLRYAYDNAGRHTGIQDSAGNRIEYTLDAAGNRTGEQILDNQGQLRKNLTRAMDALGRLQTLTGVVQYDFQTGVK